MSRRFPYFKLSEAVWGSKASIHIPYQLSSEQIGPVRENALVVVNQEGGNEPGFQYLSPENEVTIQEVDSQGDPPLQEPIPSTSSLQISPGGEQTNT
jgi:hypothetical protein